jgi:hypothetical protein
MANLFIKKPQSGEICMTHSSHVTRWFNNPLSNPGRYLLVTRVREFFIKLVKRAKEVAQALKARFVALTGRFLSAVPFRKFPVPGISSETHTAMNWGNAPAGKNTLRFRCLLFSRLSVTLPGYGLFRHVS